MRLLEPNYEVVPPDVVSAAQPDRVSGALVLEEILRGHARTVIPHSMVDA